MTVSYTESEAQDRFSEALNRAREGETVVITCEGEPVAELRPMKREKRGEESAPESQTMEERAQEMLREGSLVASGYPSKPFRLGKPSPGALVRFLEERGR